MSASPEPSPEAIAAAESPLVLVYNRTPTKVGGIYKFRHPVTRKITEVPPGGSALVPKVIAEGWNKVSNGLVTLTAPDADPNPRAELAAERAKTAALEAKIAAMEARHRELEQKARKSA